MARKRETEKKMFFHLWTLFTHIYTYIERERIPMGKTREKKVIPCKRI